MADPQTPTSGPWAWCWKHGSLHRVGTPPYAFGDTVFCIDDDRSGIEISEANAALIKAAPDMLELLQWLDRKGGLGLDVHERIRAEITKAKDAQNV